MSQSSEKTRKWLVSHDNNIRELLRLKPDQAIIELLKAYQLCPAELKHSFVAALAFALVSNVTVKNKRGDAQ